LWVGIEWDEANRGKHNGTVNGYKYFTCDTNKGSMIKYEKIEFGYRLETALFRRYFRADELHHAKDIYDNIKRIKQEQE
jgi:dynactin complex subunit